MCKCVYMCKHTITLQRTTKTKRSLPSMPLK